MNPAEPTSTTAQASVPVGAEIPVTSPPTCGNGATVQDPAASAGPAPSISAAIPAVTATNVERNIIISPSVEHGNVLACINVRCGGTVQENASQMPISEPANRAVRFQLRAKSLI